MYYFIVNPNSRCGRGRNVWKKLESVLKAGHVEYQAFLTEKPGDAKRFARELTEGCRESSVIIGVGGDGTVNEILDGISFCGSVTFGYIPAGSGNDLARSLKLPKNPVRCLKKILHPKYYKLMDYGVLSYGDGEISHRRFMVSAGIGMDAAVCHNILYSKSKGLLRKFFIGKLIYILIGIKQLILAKPSKGYILLNGVQKIEFSHAYFISVHIHPYEGGGFKFAPDANFEDGQLSVCVMNSRNKRKLIPVLIRSLMGRKSLHRGIRFYTCEEVMIHMDHPMAVHVDGESCFCQNDVQLRCIGKKLRMIV
ncbi:diacylglycerol/lipid kinase family protein [Lacrimispora sp.]|uniref:diacylglycerol/lipid kinase family protein n=1 Tax=Lacrimispora sp. TaxID=2719234 RepID=UPI002897AE3B|nr:diacylglycerol kinase family lipid kinase [Lacrimispora sp.]